MTGANTGARASPQTSLVSPTHLRIQVNTSSKRSMKGPFPTSQTPHANSGYILQPAQNGASIRNPIEITN